MKKLTSCHNAGFFSCCNIKLYDIITFFNHHRKIPDIVDSSQQFSLYKKEGEPGDITYDYFKHEQEDKEEINFQETIQYHHEYQFSIYKNLEYSILNPFIKKYFSPSDSILQIISKIEEKYKIDYCNTCVIFYRGNDKVTETSIPSYEQMIEKANDIKASNPNIRFLIQSDETEFIESLSILFPNSVYFKDEIRHMKKCCSTVDIVYKNLNNLYSKYYLAITIIMAKCKYIVCGSGNCSFWIVLYRGNADNVYQNRSNTWV